MSPETNHTELTALEQTLALLAPAPSALDRDRLFFRAGQAAAPKRSWFWPASAVGLALLAATLELSLAFRPGPTLIVQTVVERVPVPVAPGAPSESEGDLVTARPAEPQPSSLSCYRLEQMALRAGIDAVPDTASVSGTGASDKTEQVLHPRDTSNFLDLHTP